MFASTRRSTFLLAAVSLLILGALFAIEGRSAKKPVTMTNPGGQMNQCDCTKRLE